MYREEPGMKDARARRRGVGMLLMVLAILSVLFVVAITQYLVMTVARSKQVLMRITIADYACESALDEVLVKFKAGMNPVGEVPAAGSIPFSQLHLQLTTTGRASTIEVDPAITRKRYRELYGSNIDIEKVKISLDARRMRPAAVETTGPPETDIETQGIMTFQVVANYDGTRKTMRRAYEYRQTVVQPPGQLQDCAFAATDWRYLENRLEQTNADWDSLHDVVEKLVRRICFTYSLLCYICEPQSLFGDAPGANVNVGFHFAQAVLQARQRALDRGDTSVEGKLQVELDKYAAGNGGAWPPNPNFNLRYLQAMASCTNENLKKVLERLGDDFGLSQTDDDPVLGGEEAYPLSPEGRPSREYVGSFAHNGAVVDRYRIRNWGRDRTIGDFKDPTSGQRVGRPELSFKFGRRVIGEDAGMKTIPRGGRVPEAVVPAADGATTTVDSEELRMRMRVPPIMPTRAIDAATPQPGEQTSASLGFGLTRDTLDQYINDCRVRKMSHLDLEDFDPEVRALTSSGDVQMPAFALTHPRTWTDWSFRLAQSELEDKFAGRLRQYEEWKTPLLQRIKAYSDGVRNSNEPHLPRKVRFLEHVGRTLASEIGDTDYAETRASFVFPSEREFIQAMADLSRSQGVGTDTLVMDGVYKINAGTPQRGRGEAGPNGESRTYSSADTAHLVTIPQTQFRGEGVLTADGIDLHRGIRNADPTGHGNLIVWGTGHGTPCALGGTVQASVLSRGPLSISDRAEIQGMLAVEDIPCQKAQPVAENRNTRRSQPSAECAGSGSGDQVWASYYWTKLPTFTISYKKEQPSARWIHSHFNLSPYRLAAAGSHYR
jgi:hypothetical protein